MTGASKQAASRTISAARLDLVLMDEAVMNALLEGDRPGAERRLGCTVPAGWPDDRARAFLEMRRGQVRAHPEHEPWLARALVLRTEGLMIGHAGFHGPPSEGRVEFGYTVFPEYRGAGFALEASRALMEWAEEVHGVTRFRLSARPDNAPSLRIIERLGFVQTGAQIDQVDGLELVFELER